MVDERVAELNAKGNNENPSSSRRACEHAEMHLELPPGKILYGCTPVRPNVLQI